MEIKSIKEIVEENAQLRRKVKEQAQDLCFYKMGYNNYRDFYKALLLDHTELRTKYEEVTGEKYW